MRIGKFLIFVSFLFTTLTVVGQSEKKLQVTGQLEYLPKGKAKLNIQYRVLGIGFRFDSAVITDGRFSFERETSEPIIVSLSVARPATELRTQGGTPDFLSLFLLPGEAKIKASDNLATATITGTAAKANTEFASYNKWMNDLIAEGNKIRRTTVSLPPELRESRLQVINDSLNLIKDEYNKTLVLSNPQSPLAVYAFLDYAGQPVWTPRKKMDPEGIEKMLKLFPKQALSYPSMVALEDELQVAKETGPGKPIIDFALLDPDGKTVKLSDYKGKYVFLDFWASWCVPCRKENPNMKLQYEKFKDKGFTILSVSLDRPDARTAWLAAIEKDQIGMWRHVSDLKGFDSEVARAYWVKSIPTNFLISPDGKFLARNLYGEALNKALDKLFKAE